MPLTKKPTNVIATESFSDSTTTDKSTTKTSVKIDSTTYAMMITETSSPIESKTSNALLTETIIIFQ